MSEDPPPDSKKKISVRESHCESNSVVAWAAATLPPSGMGCLAPITRNPRT